jgi:glycosyltransferase involved in cell wall biosynthesis
MVNLRVILRTCSNSLLQNKLDIPRICGNNRQEMVYRCVKSLVATINNTIHNVEFIVLDDNSDEAFLTQLRNILNGCNVGYNLIHLDGQGFNYSAGKQFELAAYAENLVYIVEDDYLHAPDALDVMVEAHSVLGSLYGDNVVIFPFDCPFRYEMKNVEPTMIYYDGKRYWRQVNRTSHTILTNASTIQQNYTTFAKLASGYPTELEDTTINTLYKKVPPQHNQTIWAFNPIPSLAYHLSYETPPEIRTPYNSWEQLWRYYENQ